MQPVFPRLRHEPCAIGEPGDEEAHPPEVVDGVGERDLGRQYRARLLCLELPIGDEHDVGQAGIEREAPSDRRTRILLVESAVAIVLAGLGIYGLLAFTVSMRQQEFGIRLALGAGQGDIFRMVLVQGARLAVAGLLPGLALAYIAARLMESLLAGVRPADALTFSTAAALCLITTLLGALFPALRAVRADPTAIMRAE